MARKALWVNRNVLVHCGGCRVTFVLVTTTKMKCIFYLKTQKSKLYRFFFFGFPPRVSKRDMNAIFKRERLFQRTRDRFPQPSLHYVINHFEQQVAAPLSFSPTVGLAYCQEPQELLFSAGCCCTSVGVEEQKAGIKDSTATLRLAVAGTHSYKGSSKIIRIM